MEKIRQVFTLLEVARHLARNPDDSVEIEGLIAEFVAVESELQIKRSGVKCSNGTWNYWYPQKSTVTRERLLLWCEQRAIRPAFLFPEQDSAEKPLNARERDSLQSIIRALAELHGIKAGSGAYRKEAAVLITELAEKKITAPCNDQTLAKHLKACFEAR
ncbi:MAG: hypothetical protein LM522_08945 [Candidatus Contendobacter sp.]|nr:hypothetical protein [Candidatus Contendobacter sp.]